MAAKWLFMVALGLILGATACAPKRAAAPPPTPPATPAVKQNVFVLLPEPQGSSSGIVVKNQGGSQDLTQPYQAVRVQRIDVAPSPPFTLDQPEVRRVFGSALDALPPPEVVFVLHFDEGRDVLNAESQAQIPAILNAIRERSSTAITVTGHTDTTADPQFNYQLGLRRAQTVAGILRNGGVNATDLFISSHGDADLLVKTARGVAEAQNRRVEVIVR
jgi:outer membrane protein OmpA-like peptidoglycan-associated protein